MGAGTDASGDGGTAHVLEDPILMPPGWFIAVLLLMNLLAYVSFVGREQWPWAMIYAGATMIQVGSLWLVGRR